MRKVPEQFKEVGGVFSKLTRMWLFAAYAHRLPAEEEFSLICDEWSGVFGANFPENQNSAEAN